jgi:hypothetical protein
MRIPWGFIKSLPLALVLPLVVGAASVKPDDAVSNLAAWALVLHLPEWQWLHSPGIDAKVTYWSLGLGIAYAILFWPLPRLLSYYRDRPQQDKFIPPQTIVKIPGYCEFSVDGRQYDCERVILYMHFPFGRTQINVLPHVLGAVAFSGGRDLQIRATDYFLYVDKIIISSNAVAADGFCILGVSDDGNFVKSAEGSALAHDGRVFKFKLTPEDRAVAITHLQ